MKFARVEINNFYNLKNVDLDLSNGVALIVGPNGSGKSNIIKCIDFLVQYFLGETDKGLKIWDENQPEWHIRVDAVLTKDEVQLISNLRVCYLLFMTGLIAGQIQKEKARPHRNYSGHLNLREDRKMSRLIEQVNNELLPKLIEITKEHPGNGSRVYMCVHQGAGSGELDYSYDIRMRLPSEQQMKEEKCILATFTKLFGEGVFTVPNHSGYHDKISDLVADEKWYLIDEVKFDGVSCYSDPRSPFNTLRKSPAFSSWMHDSPEPMKVRLDPFTNVEVKSVAEKVFFGAKMLSSLGREIVKHLLENNLCILPQSRELLQTENKISLDVKKAERMLIQASISENHQKQDRFTCVTKALKSFCDLEIRVREKKFDFRHANEKVEYDLRNFAFAFEDMKEMKRPGHGKIPINAEERLLEIAKELAEQKITEPSWTGSLQVLVTRTMPTNGPTYSITTPLSGLSGGEIELLMTLCAVHLSGADTVFLDEPGHSLHPPMQAQLRRWLETQRPRDQVCVVVSHSTEFVSPQSLRCLYHMSFLGQGFTPFRLRLVSHDVSLTDVTTAGKKKDSASVEEVKTSDSSDERNLSHKDTESVSNEEDQTSGPSDDRNVSHEDTESVSSEDEDQASGPSSNITASDNTELAPHGQELAPPRKKRRISPSSRDGSAFKKYQESASEKEVQASQSEVTFTEESMTMLMRPDMRKMFFATGLYFVEGESDKRVLSALRHVFMEEASLIMETSTDPKQIRQAMKVQEMDQWDILTLGGCGDAVKAYKAATELKIPCAVVLDFDAITVKYGKQVQPFNEANWKKSKLFRGLEGKKNKDKDKKKEEDKKTKDENREEDKNKNSNSLPFAQTLLTEVENVFQEPANLENAVQAARDALKRRGFFIWEGDLEAVICDNPTMRDKLLEMKNFLKVVEEHHNCSSSHDSRKPMSAEEAQDNYDEKVLEVLLPLAEDLVCDLKGTREKIAESPTESVTGLLDLINKINNNKKVLSTYETSVASEALELIKGLINHLVDKLEGATESVTAGKALEYIKRLVDEFDDAQENTAKRPTITGKALENIFKLNKKKQVLSHHKKFVMKGTKGKGKNRVKVKGRSDAPSRGSEPWQQTADVGDSTKDSATGKQGTSVVKSKPVEVAESSSPVPQQRVTPAEGTKTADLAESSSSSKAPTISSDEPVPEQQVTPRAENEASKSTKKFRTEALERMFWERVKRKLHDEKGWTKMPWETLLEVVRVCLQCEPSPLEDVCKFMKQTQCKGKKRKREPPQDLLSRFLSSKDGD